MSQINSLWQSVDLLCPHCEEMLEIDDVDVSVTVWGFDVARPADECVYDMVCDGCGKKIIITAQLDIGVAKGSE